MRLQLFEDDDASQRNPVITEPILFSLKTEYIELYKLLKVTGVCPTGGSAKLFIADGLVHVDGQVETRKACKIRSGQIVIFGERKIEVKEETH